MKKEVTLLVTEDDPGHATLIEKNLRRAGVANEILCFDDGQKILDFLFQLRETAVGRVEDSYVLLLDIRLPKVDGVEVLRRIKQEPQLQKIPVIMLTTTDDPRDVDRCHQLGCSHYVTKPVEYDQFAEILKQLGLFLMIVEVPSVSGPKMST